MAENGVVVAYESDPKDSISVNVSGNEPASRRRLRSLVWNDFTKERTPDGNYVAICNHCKKQLSASSRSGTTHLKNHLATCLNTKVRKRRKLVVRRLVLKGDVTDGSYASTFDQDASRQDLARMIVLHGYPFSIVTHDGFKAFVKNLQPQFKMISDEAIKDDCMKIYEGWKIKLYTLLEKLSSRVNLTVDMWRSDQDVEYVCLTCHYVDNDWKLKRKILNFLHVDTAIPGEEISKIVESKLHEWGLHKKLFSVILDNCHDSDVVARELPDTVLLKGSLPLNGELFNLRSAASVLNAMAQIFATSVSVIINKVSDSIQYVKSSQTTLNNFQEACRKVGIEQKSLNIDIPNGWAQAYLMLDFACECQAVFAYIAEFDPEFTKALSSEEWDIAKAATECLCVFYHTIEKFSVAKTPTSNLFFNDISGIHLLLKTWKASNIPIIASMASEILENLEQYWGTTVLVTALASILDPRYKFKSIEYYFSKIYDDKGEADARIENIRKYLVNLYNEYVIQSNNASNDQAFMCYFEGRNNGNTAELKDGSDPKTSSRTLFDARKGLDQYLQETSSTQPHKSDLDLYLDEPVYPSKGSEDNFNILAWWKFHTPKYPVLSAMARDILGIPVSIVAIDSESRVLNEYLSSLDPSTLQGLICGQDWLRDEFEAPAEPSVASTEVTAVALPANLDDGVDECMMATRGD